MGYGVSHLPAHRPDLGCRHRRPRVGLLAGPRGHRPFLVERTDGLWTGGHAVDIRGTALEVVERMGLDAEVRDARTQLLRLSAVRPDGRRTYDVALRPMHEMRGDREVEIMRDDLVRILYSASATTSTSDSATRCGRSSPAAGGWASSSSTARRGRSTSSSAPTASIPTSASSRSARSDRFTHHLGAYLSIFTVDNLLAMTDQAVLYNEPGRAAAMFTVRGNERAKALLLFRSPAASDRLPRPGLPSRRCCDSGSPEWVGRPTVWSPRCPTPMTSISTR